MKERLDVLLVKRGLADSREKAKAFIMAGNVYVRGEREDKAGMSFDDKVDIEIKGLPLRYVSRGGLKLEKAVDVWEPPIEGAVCMDVGSSTGGFTDCMLQNGAKKVYAIDVGTNQLAWKLRQDERVICKEKTNIRYVTPDSLPELMEFVTIDVAFISLTKIMTAVFNLMKDDSRIVCLIKPQFEAGREKVGKKGVVREPEIHLEVINNILDYISGFTFEILGLDYSPVRGPEGNIEYLLYMHKCSEKEYEALTIETDWKQVAIQVVEQANSSL